MAVIEECTHGNEPDLCPRCRKKDRELDSGWGSALRKSDRPGQPMAEFESICPECLHEIYIGDRIMERDRLWVHERCGE